jgi:signal transduction histidine kinase
MVDDLTEQAMSRQDELFMKPAHGTEATLPFYILENLPALVYLKAADYSVPYANRFFRDHFGDPEDHACYALIYGRTEPCKVCPTFRVWDTGKPAKYEWAAPNGRVYEMHSHPYAGPNGEKFVLHLGVDITDRKKAEAALREKTDALERSNKDLEEFAHVTAHDLREPLVGIGAYLKLLERRSRHRLDDESRKFVTRAVETVARMDSLIQSLLTYSRVTENSEELETIDANYCLRQALANLKSVINETATSVTSDSLPTLKARPAQLVQVFQNLIGNGIKFRGTEPPKVHVAFTPGEDDYHFSVSDNGRGIELPYFDKIFQIFQRVEDSFGPSGTGIGLATCKKIVERHGGRIWVESKPGKGSTFHFTFPKS